MSCWRNRSRILLIVGTALSVLLFAATAHAGTKQYVRGSLIIEGFDNTTTNGTAYPFDTHVFLGIPFGQFCNTMAGPGTTGCGGMDANAKAGSPLTGQGLVSVTAYTATPTKPARFTVPASKLARALGAVPTSFSYPLGTQPGAAGRAFRIPQCRAPFPPTGPDNCSPGGSFSYYFPYVYSYTYADLKNQAGNFFANGGPGSFTYNYKRGGLQVGKVVSSAGGKQFGGTMALLGDYLSFFDYYRQGGASIGSLDWLFDVVGQAPNTTVDGVKVYTTTVTGVFYHTVLAQTSFSIVLANAFPWTTGMVTVETLNRGPFPSNMRRAGYDNRTVNGEGTIQLVSPLMTHWLANQPGFQYATNAVGIFRLTFAPEPTKLLMLGAGLSLLALLQRVQRARRRRS